MSTKRKHANAPDSAVGGAASKKMRLESAWIGGVTAESAKEALRTAQRQHKAEMKKLEAALKEAVDARAKEAHAHAKRLSDAKKSARAELKSLAQMNAGVIAGLNATMVEHKDLRDAVEKKLRQEVEDLKAKVLSQRAHAALTNEKVLSLEATITKNKISSAAAEKKLKGELDDCKEDLVIEKQNCAGQKMLVEEARKKAAKYRTQRDALKGSVEELTNKTQELTAALNNAEDQLKTIEELARLSAASDIDAAEAKCNSVLEAYHEEVKRRQLAEVNLRDAKAKNDCYEAQLEQLRNIEKQKEEWRMKLMGSSSALCLEDKQAAGDVSVVD